MTIKNEIQNRHFYYKLSFVEFLDYIGRSADIIYKKEEISLANKIKKVLQNILPLYGFAFQEPELDQTIYEDTDSSDEKVKDTNSEYSLDSAESSEKDEAT